MAKIYETQEDFERDKLKEQVQELRLSAEKQVSSGFTWMVLSAIPKAIQSLKPEGRDWLSWLSLGMNGIGIAKIVESWFTSSKAHTLDLERERMGPETIILPPGIGENTLLDSHKKAYARALEPKTFMEQVDKDCGCGLSKG